MPTFGYLAGIDTTIDMNLEGINIWHAVTGEKTFEERVFYWRRSKWLAVRKGGWKLIHNGGSPEEGNDELYDLSNDPYETKNLAEKSPGKVSELKDELMKQYSLDRVQ